MASGVGRGCHLRFGLTKLPGEGAITLSSRERKTNDTNRISADSCLRGPSGAVTVAYRSVVRNMDMENWEQLLFRLHSFV